ncbi:hypothetical protein CBR_g4554 [Chara braunii]|uniref:Reverse transcriptase domain-containing protein n=1 Tax=Chara braunii TaxID=69332 RepID=A0A388KID3_CHABU|nr:hypothetical protein CBR_g4554 [Chara braunii]|eukprot:GBG69723.1 hypothetical protein CBR_g4554 [Chara braunii]
MPCADELFDRLAGNRFFTKIDLRSGYHQIRVAAEDHPKTAFRSRFGHYEFTVMSFGLTNAPTTFQTAMNDIFRDILEEYVLVHLDDILVYSRTLEDHIRHLRDVLQRLRKHGFYAKLIYFGAALSFPAPSLSPPSSTLLLHPVGPPSRRVRHSTGVFRTSCMRTVTFDILDTDFDIILGMPWLASADHTVNFHRRTLSVRDAFGAEVACTIPLPHTSIRCQVVMAKSFRATCAYEKPEEIGLCFLRTLAVADSSPTDLSSDPRVVRLLDEFVDIFESPTGAVPDRPISHKIILEAGAVLPKGCIYRMSEEELDVLRAQLDDLLAKGWIRPSSSPYGAPVLFVRKKNKDLRLCIDYLKLNAQTVKNAGPLPRIDDLLEKLGGAKYFSKSDLKSGYHQISIRSNDRYKSTFKTRYGHFEWVVMPFGLNNAPTTFQAAMTNEFRAMLDRFVLVYLDDILVYSQTLEDHLGHLRRVLETLRRAKYKANRDKCEFVRQELEYLGHFVTPEGISPLSYKIQPIQEWPEPRNITDFRSFLGLADYYQRFIKGYLKIAAHLTKLQCEDRSFDFGEEAWESFLALKAMLLSAEVLRIYDPLLPTRVTTDVSGYGIGVVLEQHDGVDWHPVEYFSKKVPSCTPLTIHARRSSSPSSTRSSGGGTSSLVEANSDG